MVKCSSVVLGRLFLLTLTCPPSMEGSEVEDWSPEDVWSEDILIRRWVSLRMDVYDKVDKMLDVVYSGVPRYSRVKNGSNGYDDE